MNDVLSVCNIGKVFCYADDAIVIVRDKPWTSEIRKAEKAIQDLKTSLDTSSLSLNTDKMKLMAFCLTLSQIYVLRLDMNNIRTVTRQGWNMVHEGYFRESKCLNMAKITEIRQTTTFS
nr:unnamed protein product [Callosobruchus chinensis]